MDLAQTIFDIAAMPARVGLAAADASLEVANAAVTIARRGLGDTTVGSARDSVTNLLGLNETLERANRFAAYLEEDAPLNRALAPEGPVDRLLRPGGLIDRLTAPDGVLERLTEEGGGLDRALAPGVWWTSCSTKTGSSNASSPRTA